MCDQNRRGFLRAIGVVGSWGLARGTFAGDEPSEKADALRERALALHEQSVVFVIHDHNPIGPDVGRMLAGRVTGKLFNLVVDVDVEVGLAASAQQREGWSRKAFTVLDEVEQAFRADPQHLVCVRSVDDILRAQREGKIAIMLGAEGGKLLEGKLELLQAFYKRGLRELQLRWAVPNQIVEDQSLTEFGQQVVRACNRLGIIISLTHIPTPAFFDVMALATKPPIVCHGVATIAGKGFSDLGADKLKALAAHRGVLGLHFYNSYLGPEPTVERVVEQVDYLADLVGIDTIALGIDFFPTTGAWARFQREQGAQRMSWAIPHIGEVVQVTEALLARRYAEDDIKKILGGNFLRVCGEVFGS